MMGTATVDLGNRIHQARAVYNSAAATLGPAHQTTQKAANALAVLKAAGTTIFRSNN